jgi:hypothetical protein
MVSADMGSDARTGGSFKAILLGSIVDIGSSALVAALIVAVIAAAAQNTMPGATPEDLQDLIADSVPLMLVVILTGGACSFAGAYVAARLAPCAPAIHSLAVGLLGVALPVAFTDQIPPRWAHATATVLIIGLSLLAGRLAGPRRREPELAVVAPRRPPPPLPVFTRPAQPPPPPPVPPVPSDVTVA